MALTLKQLAELRKRLAEGPTVRLHADAEENEDFWASVYPEPNTGCWLWGGKMKSADYGMYHSMYAHRVSFQLHVSPLEKGQVVRHKCDTPLCVNPDHLESGSYSDNMKDLSKRGGNWQKRQTECVNRHRFDEENTTVLTRKCGKVERVCKACRRESNRKYRNGSKNRSPDA